MQNIFKKGIKLLHSFKKKMQCKILILKKKFHIMKNLSFIKYLKHVFFYKKCTNPHTKNFNHRYSVHKHINKKIIKIS